MFKQRKTALLRSTLRNSIYSNGANNKAFRPYVVFVKITLFICLDFCLSTSGSVKFDIFQLHYNNNKKKQSTNST